MKLSSFFTVFLLSTLLFTGQIYAQENEGEKTEETEIKPFLFSFSEGLAVSWLTRIIRQTDRSNFVLNDFLMGLYFRTEFLYFDKFKPMVRAAAYYPTISTFNKYPQKANTPLHFGVDFMTGVKFEVLNFSYARLNLGPAFHLFFLTSDRWNYLNLGAAAFLGVEVPIAEKWTILVNGIASFDSGNLGGNRFMEHINITYQYQVDVGIRYSKRNLNRTYIFPRKKADDEEDIITITR